jgi:PAS domain S-box-containing protein
MDRGDEPIRVLHVDDEPEFADMVAEFLERGADRLEVEPETSVEAALGRLDESFDCVVSDYEMPGMDGLEFFEAVREARPDVPFILFTGKGSEEIAAEAVSAGVTDYLQKTTGSEQYDLLINRITNAVEQSRTEAHLAAERRRFQVLFERLTQPVVEVEFDGQTPVVKRVNPAFEAGFGYDAEEIVGSSLDEYIVPEDRMEQAKDINRTVRSGVRPTSEEVTRRTAEGTREFILQNAAYEDGSGGFAIYTDITDRKKRKRELQRQNTRLSALFENFPEPTVAYAYEDDKPHVVEVNAAFVETFGYDEETALGSPIDDLIVPPDRRDEADAIDERVRDGAAIDEHLRRQTTAGIGDFRFRNIRLPDDEAIDGYAIYTDITERQTYERELERQNDLFRETQALADVGAWEYDAQTEELLWTEQVKRIHDLPADYEPTTEEAIAFYHPEDRDRIREAFTGAISRGEPYEIEARIHTADGDERWVRTHGAPEIEDGEVVGARGAIQDITERKEQLLAIRRLQREITRLVGERDPDRAADRVVEIAQDTIELPFVGVHLVDDERATLEPAAVSAPILDHFDDPPSYHRTDPDRRVDRFNWGVFETGEPAVIDDIRESDSLDADETPTRSGMVFPLGDHGVLITSSPEPDDLTETDRHLTDILATVLTAVLDRTERERALEEQKQLLEARTERLDEFVSVVSHDLRSPLSVASGRLELALEERDSEHLEAAATAVERSQHLIADLLSLTTEGDRDVETESVDLGSVAEKSWETVETGPATLVVDADRSIRADRSRLRQLLGNLYRNAVEHASGPDHPPRGEGASSGSAGGRSRLSRDPAADGSGDVTVTVGGLADGFYLADDGVGIPSDIREDVFESGYSTHDGTGLGLSIVSQVAAAHGWEVGLTESADGGARFEFTGVEFADDRAA